MWTSAQVLLAKTVLYVKMFPAVTGAAVNQDLQADIVKKVCSFHPFIDIFVTPLHPYRKKNEKYIFITCRNRHSRQECYSNLYFHI